MDRKRWIALGLCGCCALGLVGHAGAAQVDCDQVYCFSSDDFSREEALTGVCITELPDSRMGTVLLGSRVIRPGDILTAEQLAQLTFRPLLTEEDVQAQVTYLPVYQDRVAEAAVLTISVRGKVDQAPVAEDSAIETYKNMPNQGKLKVSDPEGQKLTYTVTRQPKRGTVTVSEDGSYLYTPKKNKVGTDSFTFTATDPAGKVSREATVTVQILKPAVAGTYTDTAGADCRFEAEWLRNTGIFEGEQLAGQRCFQPEKTLSRGEFLSMLVKTLGMDVDREAAFTGFSDEAPDWLKPYLAAAMRSGMTAGWPHGNVFGAGETMTGAEAAVLVTGGLDLTVSVVASGKENDGDQPAWVQNAMATMADNGISLDADWLTRGEAAKLLYQISQMK